MDDGNGCPVRIYITLSLVLSDLSARGIPNPRGAILSTGCEGFAVRTIAHTPDESLMAFELGELFARGIPNPRGAVLSTGCEGFAVRTIDHTLDASLMSFELG